LAPVPLRDGDPSQVGRYRLTARLGAGGMGVVYLGAAKDGDWVAVKVLRPELADDPEFRTRFGREVATLVRVKGMCTVRVIEADTTSRQPFIVTEYADGPSLTEYVAASGPLDAGMLYGLGTGLADALTAIHAAGVVHRDLKPSNVILAQSGPKVIDFGIAQVMDATALTRTGMTVGSAGFMAPEQVMGRAGPAADIFAWAVTVGYAASGQPPFGTGASDAILYRIVHAEPDISAVPDALRPVVQSALAKQPQDRPTAQELLNRLTGTPPQAGSAYDTRTQTVLSRTWQPTPPSPVVPSLMRPERRRRPLLLPVALSAALLAAAAGVAIAFFAAGHPATTHPPSHGAAVRTPAAAHVTTSPRSTALTSPPASAPGQSPTPKAGNSSQLPVVTIGTYTGIEPSEIGFSGDGGNVVTAMSWVSWTATGATGIGTSGIDNCIPDCASGTVTQVPATITLSSPVNGRFTVMTETRDGSTSSWQYPSSWPEGAS
jgi:serine/threonine protein kinase